MRKLAVDKFNAVFHGIHYFELSGTLENESFLCDTMTL